MSNTAIDSLIIDRIRYWILRLNEEQFEERLPLQLTYSRSKEPVPFKAINKQAFCKIKAGQVWGKSWDCAWFRLKGKVPSSWKGKHIVALIRLSGEGCIVDTDGTPLFSITGGSIFDEQYIRDRVDVTRKAEGGESINWLLEAGANRMGGVPRLKNPDPADPDHNTDWEATVNTADLVVFREDIWRLMIAVQFLFKLVLALDEQSVRRAQLIHALHEAEQVWYQSKGDLNAVRKIIDAELNKKAGGSTLETIAVGHAHIDVAWLWPLRETVRKTGRTFASQIDMIKKYPGYVFGASQPHLYKMVKDYYPGLYAKIKKAVKAGTWEVQGGMWVEADCNVPNGESLVRQLLYGKLFFRKEFGVDVKNIWLPDVFGYSAAIPQIAKLAGIDTFLTQKISWSKINKFPHTTFMWQGIDSTKVLTHFIPQEGYNSQINPERIPYHLGMVETMENFKEKGFLKHYLTTFGVGDGGGGPSDLLIERAKLCRNLDGMPKVKLGTADELFKKLHKQKKHLKTWEGELYLEHHRGTYTTQAYSKKMNRYCEQLLREAEMWCTAVGKDYPRALLYDQWVMLLLNQFHDILPGSSINRVYKESHDQYNAMAAELEKLIAETKTALIKQQAHKKGGKGVALFNSLSYARTGITALDPSILKDGESLIDENGKPLPMQKSKDALLIDLPAAAPGLTSLAITKKAVKAKTSLTVSKTKLENDYIKVSLNKAGRIISIYDKQEARELVPSGAIANQLILCDDCDNAWDLGFVEQPVVLETAAASSVAVLEKGPLRGALTIESVIGDSRISQIISLCADSRTLKFSTEVDWHESEKMLRVRFPLNLINAAARFEIQYGWLERPLHKNTSWERARWEVAAQRYADYSEEDYGIALLNDCKYGYGLNREYLELDLLRATKSPDWFADQGRHSFTYALLPHSGNLMESEVQKEAEQLNLPLRAQRITAGLKPLLPIVTLPDSSIRCEVIKGAEEGKGTIVRLYECMGRRQDIKVCINRPKVQVLKSDLMETAGKPYALRNNSIALRFKPFEIKTLRIV